MTKEPVVSPGARRAVSQTLGWLEHAVVGLNLCPFAKAPLVKGQVHVAVHEGDDPRELMERLCLELTALAEADPAVRETTLLVHPQALLDFDDYNDFLGAADAMLEEMGLEGVLQVASFHPDYRFAETEADDVANATNQSPFPTLHLLREASIDQAVAAFPDAHAIYDRNIATLRALGPAGWAALKAHWTPC